MGKVLRATFYISILAFFATVAAINSIGLFSGGASNSHLRANAVDSLHEPTSDRWGIWNESIKDRDR